MPRASKNQKKSKYIQYLNIVVFLSMRKKKIIRINFIINLYNFQF